MQNKQISNIKISDIKTNAKKYNDGWEYIDVNIFKKCLQDAKGINLSKIKMKQIKTVIQMLLVNWGGMRRALRKGWQDKLLKALKCEKDKLNKYRRRKLEKSDINRKETIKDIREIYSTLRGAIGPTSVTKVMHLLCPGFFPMWDYGIRDRFGYSNRTSGKGYYDYITEIQKILMNNQESIGKMKKAGKYGWKSKLKVIDEALWMMR